MRLSDFNPPTEGDATPAIQSALDAAQGETIEFDVEGRLQLNRLRPRNGTTIILNSGVTIAKAPLSTATLYLDGCEGVKVIGNGAFVDGTDPVPTTAKGHTIYALGTVDCLIDGLVADGASPGKDCLYVGLGTAGPNRGLHIRGGKYLRGNRNCISVVAGVDTRIEELEVAYAVSAPGAGIDIEANHYDHVKGTLCKGVKSHHNGGGGLLSIFGVASEFEDCTSYANGSYGLGASSGGYQFAETVFRPNVDVIGVCGFAANGVITVGAQPPVGTPVNFWLRNGAAKPAEYSQTYYIVSRHVGTNGIVLGRAETSGEVVALSSAGTGIMSADPYESEVRLRAFVNGQSDRLVVRGGHYYDNNAQGIFLAGAGRALLTGAEVYRNKSHQVQTSYLRDLIIEYMEIMGGAGYGGINSACGGGRLRLNSNHVSGTNWAGIAVAEWTDAEIVHNVLENCGFNTPSSAKALMHLASCLRPYVAWNRLSQPGTNLTTLYGILAEASVTHGTFTRNNLTGGGTTPANALRIMSPTCTVSNNIGRDGLPA